MKVVERAKLMGVPAVQIGKVGGDKLTVKTASGEFSAPLTELHDAWWNSIARAMSLTGFRSVSPITHLLGSWLIASVTTDNPRDRKLVTLAGILPDADGFGMLADIAVQRYRARRFRSSITSSIITCCLHGWPGAIAGGRLCWHCFARDRCAWLCCVC